VAICPEWGGSRRVEVVNVRPHDEDRRPEAGPVCFLIDERRFRVAGDRSSVRAEEEEDVAVHELSLMDDLVRTVVAEIGEAQVHVVRLQVGRSAGASAHALRFCFEVCARGTALEGATLEILETNDDELRLKEVEVT
jgi:hypothetical protein